MKDFTLSEAKAICIKRGLGHCVGCDASDFCDLLDVICPSEIDIDKPRDIIDLPCKIPRYINEDGRITIWQVIYRSAKTKSVTLSSFMTESEANAFLDGLSGGAE